MSEQQPPEPTLPPTNQLTKREREGTSTRVRDAEQAAKEVNASVAALRTETDRARGLLGFGRRILVPPDEIHVVVGDGRHILNLSSERKVFGQTADRPSRYWLNSLTQVIKLKTISFTVPLRGQGGRGISALDSSKVSFKLWAHAVAKLNPDKAEVAAQRVGFDTTGLVSTIAEVGTAELVAAAATMDLEEIIADRQKLAAIAFPKVNQILSELGYDLALLTITRLDGEAYMKLVAQAEARVSKETSVATNREQLAELQDIQGRQRTEAEIRADTEMKLAEERLDAEREVESATIAQQEALDTRRHEMRMRQIDREKAAAEKSHETQLAKVELNQQLGEAEAERKARLAQLESERQAELKALQQKRLASIQLAETEAEAERLALDQAKDIERAAKLTEAEARRLREEELAQAERAKEIALIEANQVSEALQIEAERGREIALIEANQTSESMKIKANAESETELIRAEAEATAVEKRAQAMKIRAEATRAEAAAAGLAEAEVEEAQVRVAEKRVVVTRAEAEAEVERLRQLKEVEINAQDALAKLYDQSPVLIDIEKLKMQLEHEQKLATIHAETSLKAFEALAPGIKVNIFGNGGQTGQLLTSLMSLSHGLTVAGQEIPAINYLIDPEGNGSEVDYSRFLPQLNTLTPYIKQVVADVSPRMLTSLQISDLFDRLSNVVSGQEDLVSALNQIKEDASFRMVGNMPVEPLLNLLGLTPDNGAEAEMTDIEVHEEPVAK